MAEGEQAEEIGAYVETKRQEKSSFADDYGNEEAYELLDAEYKKYKNGGA